MALLFCAAAPARAGEEYHLGQGYTVGDFNVAGYANVVADLPSGGQRKALVLDDLSLYVTGHVNRLLNPFLEGEVTNLQVVHSGGSGNSGNPHVVLERFYDDIMLSNSVTLRGGKMLTPVGEWNQIHAAPLVWTTTRPIVTYRAFGEYTSGASLLYTDAEGLVPEIQLYWQPDGEILPRPSEMARRQYTDMAGLHLNWPIGLTDKVGTSFQHAQVVGGSDTQYLYGVNGKASFGRFSVDGEATYTTVLAGGSGAANRTEWGGYVLGAYALTPEISAFTWYEQFQDRDLAGRTRDVLVGLSYKPQPSLVWKAEYLKNFGSVVDTASGVYASFSVLF